MSGSILQAKSKITFLAKKTSKEIVRMGTVATNIRTLTIECRESKTKIFHRTLRSRRSEILEVHFSESNNRLFARHIQVFKAYKISSRGLRRNIGDFVETTGVCVIVPEDIKEVGVYKDWLYKIQSYIEHQEQYPTSQDNVSTRTLNDAKDRLPT